MRKKAILLYRNDDDKRTLLCKMERVPWLTCHLQSLGKKGPAEDCHILIARIGDLPSLLYLRRAIGIYEKTPLLVFAPSSQFAVLKMMDCPTCRIIAEDIDERTLQERVRTLVTERPFQCMEDPPCNLTLRERQVIALILSGEQNQAIATKLGIKLSTVYAHKKNLFIKTGVHTTSQLVVWALLREFAP